EPAMAPPGCVVKPRRVALAAFTTIFDEAGPNRETLLKPTVIVLATRCDRLVKVATPLEAVAVSVPCNVPLPAFRAAVTTVLLSPLHKLPNLSSIRTLACCSKPMPSLAVLEGCVTIVTLLATSGLTTTFQEVALPKLPHVNLTFNLSTTAKLRFVKHATP